MCKGHTPFSLTTCFLLLASLECCAGSRRLCGLSAALAPRPDPALTIDDRLRMNRPHRAAAIRMQQAERDAMVRSLRRAVPPCCGLTSCGGGSRWPPLLSSLVHGWGAICCSLSSAWCWSGLVAVLGGKGGVGAWGGGTGRGTGSACGLECWGRGCGDGRGCGGDSACTGPVVEGCADQRQPVTNGNSEHGGGASHTPRRAILPLSSTAS